jgi:hypothetical protein
MVRIAGERPRLDQCDPDTRLTQGAGRRRTHNTGPDDNDVELVHEILTEKMKYSPQRRKERRVKTDNVNNNSCYQDFLMPGLSC